MNIKWLTDWLKLLNAFKQIYQIGTIDIDIENGITNDINGKQIIIKYNYFVIFLLLLIFFFFSLTDYNDGVILHGKGGLFRLEYHGYLLNLR